MPRSVRMFFSSSPSATRRIAALLAQNAKPGDVYALRGGLGAGKTLFAQAFARAIGVRGSLRSPTFVLVSRHAANKRGIKRLYHIDLYRLRALGVEDVYAIEEVMSDRAGIALVEWPERAWRVLPKNFVAVDFAVRGERARLIVVRGKRPRRAHLVRHGAGALIRFSGNRRGNVFCKPWARPSALARCRTDRVLNHHALCGD